MTAPRWEDVPEAERDYVTRAVLLDERDRVLRARACCDRLGGCPAEDAAHRLAVHDRRIAALDAALARLAEPAQPSAAERWLAVPDGAKADARKIVEGEIGRCQGDGACAECDALRALLALAREAEGTPAPAEPAPPTRTPCHRCGKPLARRGVYHVCPHRVPCGSSGWCRVCADRSGA